MGWIDLHTHVLPGIDDGAQSSVEAFEMLELAGEDGTDELVATPHLFRPNLGAADVEEVRDAFDGWMASLSADGRPRPRLQLGGEHYVSSEFAAALEADRVLPLGGSRALLLELWPMIRPEAALNTVAAVRDAGYRPLLAHVERYGFLHEDPDRLGAVIDAGGLAQVNAAALVGRQGVTMARLIDRWLRAGWVAVVASDAHGVHVRTPLLTGAARYLESRFDRRTAERCLVRNPRSILDDEPIDVDPAPRSAGWLGRLRRRARKGG